MRCPTCGFDVPLGSTQCPRCESLLGFGVPARVGTTGEANLLRPGWPLRPVQAIGTAVMILLVLQVVSEVALTGYLWQIGSERPTRSTLLLLTVAAVVFQLLASILTIIWSWRTRKNLDAFYDAGPRWATGWSIGAWFIPCASIVLVPLVLADIARNTFGLSRSTPTVSLIWFWAFARFVSAGIGLGGGSVIPLTGVNDSLTSGASFGVLGLLLLVPAVVAVLQIAFTYLVSREQTDRMRPAVTGSAAWPTPGGSLF